MKVLLVNPPSIEKSLVFEMPLDLAYLAAVLEGAGHAVTILDMNTSRRMKDIVTTFKNGDFELVGFTTKTFLAQDTFKLVRTVKRHRPDVKCFPPPPREGAGSYNQ